MIAMRFLLVATLLAACTQPRSARCKQVCAREYECVASTPNATPFDEKECIAACAVLEADPDNLAKVKKHADCVAQHQVCSDVLDCK